MAKGAAKANGGPPITIDSIFTPEQQTREQDSMIANMLGNIAREKQRLDTVKGTNGHDGSDQVPGESRTYKEADDALTEGLKQIVGAWPAEQIERARALIQQQ